MNASEKPKSLRIQRRQTADEIAEVLSTNEKTVRRWAGAGCPHRRDAKKRLFFNDGEVRAWLDSEGRTAKPGRPTEEKPAVPDDLGGDKDYWLARKYRNQCLEDEKRLVDREEYRRLWMSEFVIVKNKCRGLGASLAPGLVGLDAAEIQGRIDERVEQVFRELSA